LRSEAQDPGFSAGLRALEHRDFDNAEAAFRELLGREPAHHGAWHALAWTYLQSGRAELALGVARRAHELSRANLDYLNTLGVAYGETGAQDLAEDCFRKALKRKPVFLHAIVNLAKSLEKQERLDEAIPLYERALALDPAFPQLATNLAQLYRARGDALRARRLLERVSRDVDPQLLAMGLAECDAQLGDSAAALRSLSAAVERHPEWTLARNSLAHALLGHGHWRDGWRHYLARHELHGREPSQPLRGTRILLRGEQGLGDVLFFLRFAALLRERGAELLIVSDNPAAHPLATTLLPMAGMVDEWLSPIPAIVPGQLLALLSRPPKGFDPDHPLIGDIKRKSFFAMHHSSPKAAQSAQLLDEVEDTLKAAKPLMKFLCDAVEAPF